MKKIVYRKVSMTIPDSLHDDYRDYCAKMGFKISTRIAKLMEAELKRGEEDDKRAYYGQ
jgi:hypothetical protein